MFMVPLLSLFLSRGWAGTSHSEKNICEGDSLIMLQTVCGRRSLSGPPLMFLQAANLFLLLPGTQRKILSWYHYYSLSLFFFNFLLPVSRCKKILTEKKAQEANFPANLGSRWHPLNSLVTWLSL